MWVRNPAGRCTRCRSKPTTPPRIKASSTRPIATMSVSLKINTWSTCLLGSNRGWQRALQRSYIGHHTPYFGLAIDGPPTAVRVAEAGHTGVVYAMHDKPE